VAKQSIKPFAAPLFPFEKDWRDYYAAKGIGGTAYISADRIRLLEKGVEGIAFFDTARAFFVKILERAFEPGRDRDVAEAMLLGVKTKIDFETLSTYSALGAIHILSVSGLHVGLLYLGLSLVFGFLLKLRPAGPWAFFGLMLLYFGVMLELVGFHYRCYARLGCFR
jgi:competence protein ComEC